jgi:hypothetical protein
MYESLDRTAAQCRWSSVVVRFPMSRIPWLAVAVLAALLVAALPLASAGVSAGKIRRASGVTSNKYKETATVCIQCNKR